MKRLIIIFFFITCKLGVSQSFELYKEDTINVIDAEGRKQGHWIIFNKTKMIPGYAEYQKVEEGRYFDNKKIGIWKEFYSNGNIKYRVTFENNRPNGYFISYHANGKIYEEGLWKNNRWVGTYKLYYENGQVQQEFKFNTMGKREGEQKYYYENGQIMIEGNWKEGKEKGIVKEYYENGDIKSEKNFNDGNLDAASTKIYEPKKPVKLTTTKNPEPVESPKIIVKKDETPNIPSQVFNGEGYWKLYNKNKQVAKDGIFKGGRLIDGKVYYYSEDGILTRIAVFKNGTYVGDAIIED